MMPTSELPLPMTVGPAPAIATSAHRRRFTLDGSDQLESQLERTRREVRAAVLHAFPSGKVEAILLGGGYGRGEGGVLRTKTGDRPYNDLEFYVALRGHRLLNDCRHGAMLRDLAHQLSLGAGIEVEFKIISLAALRTEPVSMFSYDLVMGHRWVYGDDRLLAGCEHHRNSQFIPLAEATRLLMNRCTGLLFARERFERVVFTADDADFVGRNLAKARLALGDAVLASLGRYHWSCRERHGRLAQLALIEDLPPWFSAVHRHHLEGVAFKLHPVRAETDQRITLTNELAALTRLSGHVWLWLESRRLGQEFASVRNYVLSEHEKCRGSAVWRNLLLHVRTFGPRGLLIRRASRYPRERVFNALSLLLWQPAAVHDSEWQPWLRAELGTSFGTFAAAVAAYERLWSRFR